MFKEAQKDVDDFVQQFKPAYWQPLEIFARIVEETGELARLLNHMYGPKKKKATEAQQELGQEIADVMFALICLANSHNIDLDVEFKKIIEKSNIRDKDRFERK